MSSEQALAPQRTTVRTVRRIQPTRGLIGLDLGEVWRFRELLYYLIWRDVKTRYRQTFLGAFWAIFRPFISMVIMSVVFGRLAGIDSGSSVPYPLFLFAGNLIWGYFSSSMSGGSSSVLGSGGLDVEGVFPARLRAVRGGGDAARRLRALLHRSLRALRVVHVPAAAADRPRCRSSSRSRSRSGSGSRSFSRRSPSATATSRSRSPSCCSSGCTRRRSSTRSRSCPRSTGGCSRSTRSRGLSRAFAGRCSEARPPGYGALGASIVIAAVLVVTGLFHFRRAERTLVDLL